MVATKTGVLQLLHSSGEPKDGVRHNIKKLVT